MVQTTAEQCESQSKSKHGETNKSGVNSMSCTENGLRMKSEDGQQDDVSQHSQDETTNEDTNMQQ